MTIKTKRRTWSMLPSLVASLGFVTGCSTEESAPTSNPPSPLPNAGLSRPSPPQQHQVTKDGTGGASQVEKDLKKDLGSPVIKPDTAPPPAAEPKKQP
jgi:hypothetical protein